MASVQAIKRGATFRLRLGLTNDIRDATFTAQVRAMGSGRLVADLSVRQLDVDGATILELESPTDDWPASNLSTDVRATLDSEVVYTETVQIKVIANVTV